jgi:hypothetical protein
MVHEDTSNEKLIELLAPFFYVSSLAPSLSLTRAILLATTLIYKLVSTPHVILF